MLEWKGRMALVEASWNGSHLESCLRGLLASPAPLQGQQGEAWQEAIILPPGVNDSYM